MALFVGGCATTAEQRTEKRIIIVDEEYIDEEGKEQVRRVPQEVTINRMEVSNGCSVDFKNQTLNSKVEPFKEVITFAGKRVTNE